MKRFFWNHPQAVFWLWAGAASVYGIATIIL